MKTIDLNLSSKPFRNNTLIYLFHGILISLVLFATAFNTYYFFHYSGVETELKSKVTNSQATIRQLQQRDKKILEMISRKDLKDIIKKSDFANNAIVMRKFSWTGLFNDLEEVLPYSVRMQSIRPAVKDRGIEIRVDGLAKNLRSFLEFEKNLQENDNFARVKPENYRKMGGSDIAFSLIFEYHPQEWSIEEIYAEREIIAVEEEEETSVSSPLDQSDASEEDKSAEKQSQG
jgi:hypothetical protein